MTANRAALAGIATLALAATLGCAHRWEHPLNPDGTYCFVFGKSRNNKTCTVQPVPSAEDDLKAKRFTPEVDALTVYVVRHRWADGHQLVPVTVDDGTTVVTVPESIIRLRLRPGRHILSAAWENKTATLPVEGASGSLQFVQLAGAVYSWSSSYAWVTGEAEDARHRALKSRLIADIEVR